jgi:hypothetical protein
VITNYGIAQLNAGQGKVPTLTYDYLPKKSNPVSRPKAQFRGTTGDRRTCKTDTGTQDDESTTSQFCNVWR